MTRSNEPRRGSQDHQELVRELGQVRERGIMRVDSPNPDLRPRELPMLREMVQRWDMSSKSFPNKLLPLIRHAVDEIPEGIAKKSAARLYGLDADPTFPRPTQWRTEARQMYPLLGADEWRKGMEIEILGLIASNIEAALSKVGIQSSLAYEAPVHDQAIGLTGAAKGTDSGFHILGGLGSWIRARRNEALMAQHAKELIGIHDTDLYSYRVAMNHPLFRRGNPHPDDAAGFNAVVNADVLQAMERGLLNIVDTISVSLDEGMVLLGSPEAEAVTRLAFGYEKYPDDRGMNYLGDTVDLPLSVARGSRISQRSVCSFRAW